MIDNANQSTIIDGEIVNKNNNSFIHRKRTSFSSEDIIYGEQEKKNWILAIFLTLIIFVLILGITIFYFKNKTLTNDIINIRLANSSITSITSIFSSISISKTNSTQTNSNSTSSTSVMNSVDTTAKKNSSNSSSTNISEE